MTETKKETDDYEQFKIKIYNLWDLYLHINQNPYVGRCYAWAKRENANFVTDMTEEETLELFHTIVPEWDSAISSLYLHDRSNVAILGNTAPHLHAHLIPRYRTPRHLYNHVFTDPNPKGNYAPYPKHEFPTTTLLQIKDDIKIELKK